ncbi:DegT/DnrJ/EryC1/StrS family aminotransferase [Bacillus inaquosorum]|nr:DegT/DnrJ/EryC1/StrS family aminotransferase [Bacillus inaquosorum]
MNKVIGAQDISKEEIQEVTETLESGWLFKISKVQQFEKEFAARHLYMFCKLIKNRQIARAAFILSQCIFIRMIKSDSGLRKRTSRSP